LVAGVTPVRDDERADFFSGPGSRPTVALMHVHRRGRGGSDSDEDHDGE
jgi:hypothetical protein